MLKILVASLALSAGLALAQSANVIDALWHYYDFPGALQSSPLNGSTMQANGRASFGGESAWGVMDAIMFAKAHGKPIAFPEIGYCSQLNTPTTSGKPTWSCDITSIGIADTNFAPYLKSRMAFAASLGVPIVTVNFNCYAPYDPYFIQGGSFGGGGTTGAMVQSIHDCFAGTGTALAGFDLLKGRDHLGSNPAGRPVFRQPHHHARRIALAEHYRQMPY